MGRYFAAILLILLAYFPAYLSKDSLIWLTREDGPFEWTAAILLLATCIAFLVLAILPKYSVFKSKMGTGSRRIYFLLFALVFLFASGEEVSWGQRIFDFETPEAIKERNVQEEFNIHNLEIFHGSTMEGEEKTGIYALFTLHRLYYLFFLFYLLFLPLLNRFNGFSRNMIQRYSIPVPSHFLGVLFLFNLIYGKAIGTMYTGYHSHGIVEIKETVISFILFALPFQWLRIRGAKRQAQSNSKYAKP